MPSNAPRPSKTERREAARREAERLAARQKVAERRNRFIIIGASVLVVALIAVAAVIIWGQRGQTVLTDFEGERPATSDDTGGIAVGTASGGIDDSVPTVAIYVDFMCPFCGQFEEVNGADVTELATSGEANVIYHPLGNLDGQSQGTNYSTRAANAFATVATDAPDAAPAFMTAMFVDQPAENTPGRTDEEIAQIAVDAGVPQEVADTFTAGTYNDWVAAATEQARNNEGYTGTPSIIIDGERFEGNWQTPGELAAAVREG